MLELVFEDLHRPSRIAHYLSTAVQYLLTYPFASLFVGIIAVSFFTSPTSALSGSAVEVSAQAYICAVSDRHKWLPKDNLNPKADHLQTKAIFSI